MLRIGVFIATDGTEGMVKEEIISDHSSGGVMSGMYYLYSLLLF